MGVACSTIWKASSDNFTFLNESYLPLWAILTNFTIFHFLCCVPYTIDGKQIVPILNLQWKIATVNVKLSRIYISIDFMHQKLQILMIKPCCFNSFLNFARKSYECFLPSPYRGRFDSSQRSSIDLVIWSHDRGSEVSIVSSTAAL